MSDFLGELGSSIETVTNVIKKFKGEKYTIMIKIGIFESGKFCSGLHSIDFFNSVKSLLDSNHFWDANTSEKTTDVIHNGITKAGVKKFKTENLHTSDFSYQNTPFDFRVIVSNNVPSSDKLGTPVITREKMKYSYTDSDYRFNLARVLETDNGSTDETFEFDIELLNLGNNTSDVYRSHSALLKIRDIINHCETIYDASVKQLEPLVDISKMTI